MVDTSGKNGRQAEEGGLPGFVGPGVRQSNSCSFGTCGAKNLNVGGVEGGHAEGLPQGSTVGCAPIIRISYCLSQTIQESAGKRGL